VSSDTDDGGDGVTPPSPVCAVSQKITPAFVQAWRCATTTTNAVAPSRMGVSLVPPPPPKAAVTGGPPPSPPLLLFPTEWHALPATEALFTLLPSGTEADAAL
jgi:hypothetical protein